MSQTAHDEDGPANASIVVQALTENDIGEESEYERQDDKFPTHVMAFISIARFYISTNDGEGAAASDTGSFRTLSIFHMTQ